MKKNTNLCVDLKTRMQEVTLLEVDKCYRGVLSRTSDDQYLFEEAVSSGRLARRNPKLFDGRYVSLVHMQNGKYQVHMRTIDASTAIDRKQLAFSIYSELIDAFDIID